MDEPSIIWRHGLPWRLGESGHYFLDAESQRIGYARLWHVAEAAYKLWGWTSGDGFGGSAVDNVRYRLEAAGFDTARGTWRKEAPARVVYVGAAEAAPDVLDTDHHHIGGQSRGGLT